MVDKFPKMWNYCFNMKQLQLVTVTLILHTASLSLLHMHDAA